MALRNAAAFNVLVDIKMKIVIIATISSNNKFKINNNMLKIINSIIQM